MFKKIFSKLLDVNQKEIDRLSKIVDEVNALEGQMKKLKKQDFKKRTAEFRKKLEGVKNGQDLKNALNGLLPEAFALVREAAWRELGLRAYDVQMIASIALFEGKVVEQKTGEGKTLSAVAPLYLRALAGRGAHLVTVNDYLSRRDAGWNAPVFALLGLSIGAIAQELKSYIYDPKFNDTSHGDDRLAHLKPSTRKQAYEMDITYGTNNEFGFDYLRDNMVQSLDQMSQRGHYFVIVDEVDSVLIDEARTPLIISAPDTDPTDKYYRFAEMVEKLNPDTDFSIDEKAKSASLTEQGIKRVEKIMGVDNLYEKDWDSIHHIENALRAKSIYLRDREYVVKDDAVTIVDEFTGRLMFGRRWSDGMHQAVEAKEGVKIQQESKTLATISFQNYFRMYKTLSGMTGTAATEAEEFKKIYELDVVVVPTNEPMIRNDSSDLVYKSLRAKYSAIVAEINQRRKKGQPILVGTTSIEKNEIIHSLLKKKNIPHNILNAKNHEKEASIISEAGKPGGVTVATNMAGRGVDIVLGGALPDKPEKMTNNKFQMTNEYKKWQEQHDKVIKAGGLCVIGTERHESRRIDNQLRGRSGRQGDPGFTRFYLSLEDDLMRIFGGEQIGNLMNRLKLPEDQPIENKLVSRAIEQAQVKVEGFHFDSRKRVVEYDDVANQQRDIIYGLRRKVLENESVKDDVVDKLQSQVERIVVGATPVDSDTIDAEKVLVSMLEIVPFDDASKNRIKKELEKAKDDEKTKALLFKVIKDVHESREKQVGEKVMRQIEKFAFLGSIDHLWIDHIDHIDGLREGVRLRGYAQRDPVAEFKNEAFNLFKTLIDRIDEDVTHRLFRIGVQAPRPTGPDLRFGEPQSSEKALSGLRPEIPFEQARTNVDQLDQTGLAGDAEITAASGKPAFGSSSGVKSNLPTTDNRQPTTASKRKIGRNDPCPCGAINPNTKKPYKYKKCGLINAPHHRG